MPDMPARTLIVEDDPSTCTALNFILKRLGHDVYLAHTVAEGLSKLTDSPINVILDLMLPDGNGIAVLRHIRQQHLPIRVMVTTGMDEPEVFAQVRSLCPEAMMRKPIDLGKLEVWLKADQPGVSAR